MVLSSAEQNGLLCSIFGARLNDITEFDRPLSPIFRSLWNGTPVKRFILPMRVRARCNLRRQKKTKGKAA